MPTDTLQLFSSYGAGPSAPLTLPTAPSTPANSSPATSTQLGPFANAPFPPSSFTCVSFFPLTRSPADLDFYYYYRYMTPGALPNPEPDDTSPKPKRARKAPASREAKPVAKKGPTTKRKKVEVEVVDSDAALA